MRPPLTLFLNLVLFRYSPLRKSLKGDYSRFAVGREGIDDCSATQTKAFQVDKLNLINRNCPRNDGETLKGGDRVRGEATADRRRQRNGTKANLVPSDVATMDGHTLPRVAHSVPCATPHAGGEKGKRKKRYVRKGVMHKLRQ